MSKKLLALAAVLLLSVQCAWADTQLWVGHTSVVDLADGRPDYSSARFHHMRITVDDYSCTPTQEYLNLKGTLTFQGGTSSFINNHVCQPFSGTSQSLTLAAQMTLEDSRLQYVPMDSEGNTISFVLSADNGFSSVGVSWSFPDMPSLNGQGTIPNLRSTQQQLDSFVPYIEYIRSGSDVTGLKWRIVKSSDTSTPVPQDFKMKFIIRGIANHDFLNLDAGAYEHEIEDGETPEGTFTFNKPISESEIAEIYVGLDVNEGSDTEHYYWSFCSLIDSNAKPYLWVNHMNDASLVNGKSNYDDAEFEQLILGPRIDRLIEAKYFTNEGSITIPGGGYTLQDTDTLEVLDTVDAGKSMTFSLAMIQNVDELLNYFNYAPIDADVRWQSFCGDISGLKGQTVTWTLPSELGASGSAVIPNFKSTSEQLAEGVPYIELVSEDSSLIGIKYKLVKAQDTSTPVKFPYKTDFYMMIEHPSYTAHTGWQENYDGNEQYFACRPVPIDTVSGIIVRVRTWEDPDNPCVHQWNFWTAEASKQDASSGGSSSSSCSAGFTLTALFLTASFFLTKKH